MSELPSLEAWQKRAAEELGRDPASIARAVGPVRVELLYAAHEADAPIRAPRGFTAGLTVRSPSALATALAMPALESVWIERECTQALSGKDAPGSAREGLQLWCDVGVDPPEAWPARAYALSNPVGALLRGEAVAEDAFSRAAKWAASTRERAIAVSARAAHDRGADAVQELAILLAGSVAHLRGAEAGGLAIDACAGAMIHELTLDSDVFVGIAKLRAARWCWAKLLAACGASAAMVIHGAPSRRPAQKDAAHHRMLRGTLAAFAAIAGGAQIVSADAHEESEAAVRLARNTQLLLREESHVDAVADPAGGSHYVETLTRDLARAAWSELGRIEEQGGILKADLGWSR